MVGYRLDFAARSVGPAHDALGPQALAVQLLKGDGLGDQAAGLGLEVQLTQPAHQQVVRIHALQIHIDPGGQGLRTVRRLLVGEQGLGQGPGRLPKETLQVRGPDTEPQVRRVVHAFRIRLSVFRSRCGSFGPNGSQAGHLNSIIV